MSKFLADLLANDHPLFTHNLVQLERAAGNDGVDTRLIGDITEKTHTVMRTLGLDPADTHGKELYLALNAAVANGTAAGVLAETHYVLARFEDGPVSLCLHDVIENAHHELAYEQRLVGHAQRHLRLEIIRRYAEHDKTDNQMVHRLAEEAGIKQEDDKDYPLLGLGKKSEAPSILAIGDIFTDAFIQLDEGSTKVIKEADGKEWLALPYGQKPHYERVDIIRSVGPSPNAAVSSARLGLNVSLMAWVGDDPAGREAIDHLVSEAIDVTEMKKESGKLTSYWYVLRYKADRTMLVKSEKYDYKFVAPQNEPDWIYLSYIGEDSWQLHEELIEYLEQHPDIKLAFQPGTFHFEWGVDKLRRVYGRSHIIVMNREEAVQVTGAPYESLQDLTKALHELGPQIVVITDGPNGSYASYDYKLVTIPNYPDPAPPLDRTGAGDAFASTIVAALALGESMDTALTWAPINSMNVVQKLGAQAGLLKKDEIAGYLKSAPEEYKVSSL
ncbi:MAG TPA: carbohydrate kinase family protein [Candidatus Saccharibacteria bacterium]|nr:carbohydrate kinase family protein [Candidatus Saccharibacteria bacterium]